MEELVRVDTQVHGYKQGHQLLSSLVTLSKSDQAVIDQLSDLAGPLRPGEDFNPYISAYPLPSGSFYVLARTWQDKTVPRAGCVRTLSMLIGADSWAVTEHVNELFRILTHQSFPSTAQEFEVSSSEALGVPFVEGFSGGELMEALFLEDSQPVAMFDTPNPEAIAVRLLTALWPAMRRKFSLSTFALSPRKLEGRYFDLVFAPLDARPRFSDWPGRRVDGRNPHPARHRWTGALTTRVFDRQEPRLLDPKKLGLLDSKEDTENAAALRISLLWDELLEKLDRSPTVILGLLDIANFKLNDGRALEEVHQLVSTSVGRAVSDLPTDQAWEFIGAISKKLSRSPLSKTLPSVVAAATELARRDPVGAVELVCHLDQVDLDSLMPALAEAISARLSDVESALLSGPLQCLIRLVVISESFAKSSFESPMLVQRMADGFPHLPNLDKSEFTKAVLPLLSGVQHLPVALAVFAELVQPQISQAFRHFAALKRLAPTSLVGPLVDRARQLSVLPEARSDLASLVISVWRNSLIRATLTPSSDDVQWILSEQMLDQRLASDFLLELLTEADHSQKLSIFATTDVTQSILKKLPSDAYEILYWISTQLQLPTAEHVTLARRLLPVLDRSARSHLSNLIVAIAMQDHFGPDEVVALSELLDAVGESVEATDLVSAALSRYLPISIISRNLQVFSKLSAETKQPLLRCTDRIAHELTSRFPFELDRSAAEALAELFWDAESAAATTHLKACGILLPPLLKAWHLDISIAVAATFPPVYRMLSRESDEPSLMSLVPFYEWDRCKVARKDLVHSFMISAIWQPWHLALTACLTGDVSRILGRIPKRYDSDAYLQRLTAELDQLPESCKEKVSKVLITLCAH